MERWVSNPRCICGKKMQFKDPVSQSPFRHSPHCGGGAEGGMQISVAEQLHNTLRAYVARPLSRHSGRCTDDGKERSEIDSLRAKKFSELEGAGGSCPPSPCASALACQFLPSSSYLPFKSLLRDFSLKRCEMASNCLCDCACPTRSSCSSH